MTKYTKEMFVRDKLDIHNIADEWDIIASSSFFKDEYKNDGAEKEVILGYANALNCIADSILKQNHSPGTIMQLRTDSLTIPFIFLARHTVELSLKYVCRLIDIDYKPSHGLVKLWNDIVARLTECNCTLNDGFDDVRTFICAMEELDCDGSHSRYSKDNNGKLYNEKPKAINVRRINDFIQKVFTRFADIQIQ